MSVAKPKSVCVRVRRDTGGEVISEVGPVDKEDGFVVIDRHRARDRMLSPPVIISRAKSLADVLGAPYVEDLKWRCVADKKLACRCPKCVEAGRV